MMVVYEIHTFRDGAWKIDSIFDDRDLAVLEAQRVDRAHRYSGVRVVEETYDQVTDKTVTRTIYRSSRVDKPNNEAFHRRAEAIQRPTRPRSSRPVAPAKPPASLSRVLVMATLTAGAILFSGLGALYALNALTH
jgi:hypothetical protein